MNQLFRKPILPRFGTFRLTSLPPTTLVSRTLRFSSRAAASYARLELSRTLVVSCTVSVSLAQAHSSESSYPTGPDVSAYGGSPLSLFPETQRQHPMFRPPQLLPSLTTRLNLRVSRSPRTRQALALHLAVFLDAGIFPSDAPSARGRIRRPPDRDPSPPNRWSRIGCRGGTAGSTAALNASC